jgi:hypothetical protein
VSAAGQARVASDVVVANERASAVRAVAPAPKERSPFLPLLLLVIGLAAAAVWFVALPQLNKPATVQRSCEVIVLKSGKNRCVANPKTGSKDAAKKAASAKRAKQ